MEDSGGCREGVPGCQPVDDDASSATSLIDLAATLELAVKEIRLLEAAAGGNRSLEQKLVAANGTS